MRQERIVLILTRGHAKEFKCYPNSRVNLESEVNFGI